MFPDPQGTQQDCIRFLLERSSPVRAQNPGPPDALTQCCRPSICIQLTFLNYTGPDRCLVGRPWTLRLEGDTVLRGSVVLHAPQPPFSHHLATQPSAFPSLGEAGPSAPATCKYPGFAPPLSEQKSCINGNKVPVEWTLPSYLLPLYQPSTTQSRTCPIPPVNKGPDLAHTSIVPQKKVSHSL